VRQQRARRWTSSRGCEWDLKATQRRQTPHSFRRPVTTRRCPTTTSAATGHQDEMGFSSQRITPPVPFVSGDHRRQTLSQDLCSGIAPAERCAATPKVWRCASIRDNVSAHAHPATLPRTDRRRLCCSRPGLPVASQRAGPPGLAPALASRGTPAPDESQVTDAPLTQRVPPSRARR